MRFPTSTPREAAEDIYFGQAVIIWARWFVILAAAILALWSSDSTGGLALRAAMVIGLMALNFFLHGRSIMERPVNKQLLLAISLFDLAIVGGMIAFWGVAGVPSQLYVLYYPLVFGVALVFQPRQSAVISGLAVMSYLAICVISDPAFLGHSLEAKAVAMRVITICATAALGTYYWRIQRERRRLVRPAAALGRQ